MTDELRNRIWTAIADKLPPLPREPEPPQEPQRRTWKVERRVDRDGRTELEAELKY